MKPSIFLSYPTPHLQQQKEFLDKVQEYLEDRELHPRTLGVTDYDYDAPLKAIRRLMLESNGLIAIAFRRYFVNKGAARYQTDIPDFTEQHLDNIWFTSPWIHIEAAMAYQLGLPILILRERGVVDDGLLGKGIAGLYMPVFDTLNTEKYFTGREWKDVIEKWIGYVRSAVDKKGCPPQLY